MTSSMCRCAFSMVAIPGVIGLGVTVSHTGIELARPDGRTFLPILADDAGATQLKVLDGDGVELFRVGD